MLDTKQSWDELVLRHAPDEETAYRILENRLYHNLTARFVQSHDYIAMERLYELHQSGEYDLIVIDTPPTRNALDFLEAPERMADFFGGRLLRWLTLPYRVGGKRGSRVLNVASRPFYQVADRILGSQFLEDIAEFFLNFQSMYDGFGTRAKAVEQLLHDRRTTFVGGDDARGRAAARSRGFCDALDAGRFHLGALVLNRTLPDSLLSADGARAAARVHRRRAPRRPPSSPASRRDRRARRHGANRAGAAHGRRVVPELLARREARGGAAGRAHTRARGHRARARRSTTRSPTCRGLTRVGDYALRRPP